jgi:hypothetical protein
MKYRMFKVGDRPDAVIALVVEGERPDGCQVTWSLGVQAGPEKLTVDAAVEITLEDGNVVEVFTVTSEPQTAAQAADVIERYATRVSAERSWMTEGKSS